MTPTQSQERFIRSSPNYRPENALWTLLWAISFLLLCILQGCSDEPQVNPNRLPFERPPVPEPTPRVHVSLSGAAIPVNGTPAAIVPSPSVVYAGEPFTADITATSNQPAEHRKNHIHVEISRPDSSGRKIISGGGFLRSEKVIAQEIIFKGRVNAPKRAGEYNVEIRHRKESLGVFTISVVVP